MRGCVVSECVCNATRKGGQGRPHACKHMRGCVDQQMSVCMSLCGSGRSAGELACMHVSVRVGVFISECCVSLLCVCACLVLNHSRALTTRRYLWRLWSPRSCVSHKQEKGWTERKPSQVSACLSSFHERSTEVTVFKTVFIFH
jgi:hypothetical protein